MGSGLRVLGVWGNWSTSRCPYEGTSLLFFARMKEHVYEDSIRLRKLFYLFLSVGGNMSTAISLYVGTCLQRFSLYEGTCLRRFYPFSGTCLRFSACFGVLVYGSLSVCGNWSTGFYPFVGTCLRLFACMEEHVHCYSIRLSEHVYRWLPV